MYYEKGNFKQTDGSYISSFEKEEPVKINKVNKIHDADKNSIRAWIWDIALDEENKPVVTYTLYPSSTNHLYCHARWNGNKWIKNEVVDAGKYITIVKPGKKLLEPHYSGGIVLDHGNPSTVFLSREVNGTFEIEKRVIGGSDNQKIKPITSRSKVDN